MAGVGFAWSTPVTKMPNGIHPTPPLPSDLAEYQKIIRLRDDVVAGRHPKFKGRQQAPVAGSDAIPAAVAMNAAAAASNNAVPLNPQNTNYAVPSSLLSSSSKPYHRQGPSHGQRMSLDGHGSLPGLDPALPNGPPLLTPADRNLSRSVIQTHLANEIKRQVLWPKLDRENILPEYDVDDMLRKAHKEVKPLSFDKSQTKERASASGSADDNNSYYSSQHNDEEEVEEARTTIRTTKPCPYYFKGRCNRGDACKFSHDPAFEAQLKPVAPLTQTDRQYANMSADGPPLKKTKRVEQDSGIYVNLDQDSPGPIRRRVDEFGRDIPPGRIDIDDAQHTPNRRKDGSDRRNSGRVAAPIREGPIIRNQILSPVAPQPARVSPLAMSKGAPRVEQIRLDDSRGPSAQGMHSGNPRGPAVGQQPLSRKRRRDREIEDGSGGVIARRRVESPAVQIKEEPASPRVVSELPQYRYVDREDDGRQPVLVESYPVGVRRIEHDGSREIHYIDDPGYRRVSSPMVRVVSRAEPRYGVHREPELRRVVSERHPLRAGSPVVHSSRYIDDQVRQQPAPSIVYLSRSDNEQPGSYRASVAPPSSHQQGPRGLESARTEYVEPRRVQSPILQQSMAPPSIRRIIRDQYGNEFYEPAAPDPRRFSVAPEPRYAPEHAYAARPLSRMASAVPDLGRHLREGTVVQRRDDQEPTSPRYVEGPVGRAPSAAPYARREPSYVQRQGPAPPQPQIVRIDDGPRVGSSGGGGGGGSGIATADDHQYERVIYRQAPPGAVYADRPPPDVYHEQPREVYGMHGARPEAVRYGSMAPPPSGQRYEYVEQWPSRQERQYVMD